MTYQELKEKEKRFKKEIIESINNKLEDNKVVSIIGTNGFHPIYVEGNNEFIIMSAHRSVSSNNTHITMKNVAGYNEDYSLDDFDISDLLTIYKYMCH